MKHRRFTRVDMQVFLLTAAIVVISCGIIFMLNYAVIYRSMMADFEDRAFGIYNYLESMLGNVTFEDVNVRGDEEKEVYTRTKAILDNIRSTTGVRYLYTAKQAPDGTYIYLIDGLASDSEDFRNIGDPIEPEIIPDIERALAGQNVLPNEIKDTSWGYIFISYFPIYSGGEVIGVLGIEFDAGRQYITFHMLRWITPAVIFISCLAAALAAIYLFRRISNPTFQDLATTDMLTGLKNRNAFETDLHNLDQRENRERIGFIVADLDGLKAVNDACGHQAGDEYIRAGGELLRKCIGAQNPLYRIGGDEFAVVFLKIGRDQLEKKVEQIRAECGRAEEKNKSGRGIPCLSVGGAVFDRELDGNLNDTLRRADDAMYRDKKQKRKK